MWTQKRKSFLYIVIDGSLMLLLTLETLQVKDVRWNNSVNVVWWQCKQREMFLYNSEMTFMEAKFVFMNKLLAEILLIWISWFNNPTDKVCRSIFKTLILYWLVWKWVEIYVMPTYKNCQYIRWSVRKRNTPFDLYSNKKKHFSYYDIIFFFGVEMIKI